MHLAVVLVAALACNVRMHAPETTVRIVLLHRQLAWHIACDSLNFEDENLGDESDYDGGGHGSF